MNRIFPRTLLALLGAGAIPVLLMLAVAVWWAGRALDDSRSESTARVAVEVARQIEMVLARSAFQLTPLTKDERLIQHSATRLAEMKRIAEMHDDFTEIALYDEDGYVIESSSSISATQETTSWFKSARDGQLTRSRPFLDSGGEQLCYSVYVPVNRAISSDVAVLKATLPFNRVEQLIRSVILRSGEQLLALDQFGNCVGRSSGEFQFQRFDPEIRKDIWRSRGFYQMPNGVPFRYVSVPVNPPSVLEGDHLRLLWLTPEAHYAEARWNLIEWILSAGLIAIVPLSLLSWLLARSLSRPLIRAAAGARLVADGDLTTELQLVGPQEIQELACAFNTMVAEVGKRTNDLEAANESLEQSGRMKDQFLATMSHELRTPLNSVIGFSEALESHVYGELTESQQAGVHEIKAGGEQLLGLIDNILDVTKLTAGVIELRFEEVRLPIVCAAVTSRARDKARANSLRVTSSVDDQVVLRADRRRLEQILDSLFDNAIKFTPEGGSIRLDAHQSPLTDEIVIKVTDTGIGIVKKHLESLFEPFVQLDSDLVRQHAGAGVGLTIVRELTHLHSGTVEVESALDKGCTFTIRLPGLPSVESETPPAKKPLAADNTSSEPSTSEAMEVVLIEDNALNLIPIRSFLQSKNHRVRVAQSGGEGIELARNLAPDLVVLDAQSAGVDPERTSGELRLASGRERLSIIALIAPGAPELLQPTSLNGPDRYLAKPVQFNSLETAICDLLSA